MDKGGYRINMHLLEYLYGRSVEPASKQGRDKKMNGTGHKSIGDYEYAWDGSQGKT